MVEELKKRDEDDEFKNDFDPKGYDLFDKSVSAKSIIMIYTYSLRIPLKQHTVLQYWLHLQTQKQKNYKLKLFLFI